MFIMTVFFVFFYEKPSDRFSSLGYFGQLEHFLTNQPFPPGGRYG
jgi:hypothetical protein